MNIRACQDSPSVAPFRAVSPEETGKYFTEKRGSKKKIHVKILLIMQAHIENESRSQVPLDQEVRQPLSNKSKAVSRISFNDLTFH